jgi:hypothetical protein
MILNPSISFSNARNENVKKSAIEQKIRDMFVKEKRGKDAVRLIFKP